MKKFIFVLNAIELLGQLKGGKYVQGVMYVDKSTGSLTFRAYNRQPRKRAQDLLVKKLPWGWVKTSIERVKVFAGYCQHHRHAERARPRRHGCADGERTPELNNQL